MNSRFAVAVHILTVVARSGGEPVASEYIAASVNTNASLVRRLLCGLSTAGLTRSRLGAGGGTMLARDAAEITLAEIFRAVDAGALFAMHRGDPNPACPVGRHIRALLRAEIDEATRALERQLETTTLAQIVAGVSAREALAGDPAPRPG